VIKSIYPRNCYGMLSTGKGNHSDNNGENLLNNTKQASRDTGETIDIRHRLLVLLVPGLKGMEGVVVNLSFY
jgi:hypothetical protein